MVAFALLAFVVALVRAVEEVFVARLRAGAFAAFVLLPPQGHVPFIGTGNRPIHAGGRAVMRVETLYCLERAQDLTVCNALLSSVPVPRGLLHARHLRLRGRVGMQPGEFPGAPGRGMVCDSNTRGKNNCAPTG